MEAVKWSLVVLATVLIIGVAAIYGYLRMTLPEYTGTQTVPGLIDEVEIVRDSFGLCWIATESCRMYGIDLY